MRCDVCKANYRQCAGDFRWSDPVAGEISFPAARWQECDCGHDERLIPLDLAKRIESAVVAKLEIHPSRARRRNRSERKRSLDA